MLLNIIQSISQAFVYSTSNRAVQVSNVIQGVVDKIISQVIGFDCRIVISSEVLMYYRTTIDYQ